jgi:hypothetical protein
MGGNNNGVGHDHCVPVRLWVGPAAMAVTERDGEVDSGSGVELGVWGCRGRRGEGQSSSEVEGWGRGEGGRQCVTSIVDGRGGLLEEGRER